MVFNPHLFRCRLRRQNFRRTLRGFSLLEIVLVLYVLGIMAAALTPSVRDLVERGQRDAEAKSLDELAATIMASFEHADLTNLNLAALPAIPPLTSASLIQNQSLLAF